MVRINKLIGVCLLLIVFFLPGCSVSLNLPEAPPTTTLPATSVNPASTTAVPATSAIPASTAAGPTPSVTPTILKIPVTWTGLNLSGRLIYIDNGQGIGTSGMAVEALDLKTGEIKTIFQSPQSSWIYSVSVSLGNNELVMAYGPASADNTPTNPALYILPLDASKVPQLLFPPASSDDEYYQPVWSPDGKYIYFTHFLISDTGKAGSQPRNTEVMRISYPDGRLENIASPAFWPNVSADSKQIVYVGNDPVDGTNKLYTANPDGSKASQVVMQAKWVPSYIDAPIFSPDGQSIMFSAVSLSQSSAPTWLEKLVGVTVASAHNVPSDWWTVPVTGGSTTQLTHLQTTGLFASFSPDNKYVACYSGFGLFVMQPDGTGLTMLVDGAGGATSSISWVP